MKRDNPERKPPMLRLSANLRPALSLKTSHSRSPQAQTGSSEVDSTEKSPTGIDEMHVEVEDEEEREDAEEGHRRERPGTEEWEEDKGSFQGVKHRYLPILSGLACPFSVLLDIPGLTERWYIRTEGYDVVETQPNPILLDAGLIVSIIFGVIANGALITRFLERKPRSATLLAIGALTIHGKLLVGQDPCALLITFWCFFVPSDVINVVTVVVFGVIHRFNDGFTYGTAYWMCVASTVASLVCNVTLIVDYVQTKDFARHGSGLTEKQRSLVIAVMSLLCYLGLGSLAFSFLITLTYIDSLYFTICTISECIKPTSVGFGDIYPISVASRVFSLFYDVAGLVLIAFTIALARETVIETFEASYRRRREVLAERAKLRKAEKRRHALERKERRERELKELLENPDPPSNFHRTMTGISLGPSAGGGRGGVGGAERRLDFDLEVTQGVSAGKAWVNRILRKWGLMKRYVSPEDKARGSLSMNRTTTQQSILGEDTYKSFRKELEKEQQREFHLKIGVASALFWSFWLVGSAVFHFTEKWSYFDALWFSFIFFTTIGYGDYSPKSSAGRAFFVAWSMLGIATMTLLLSVVTETWSSRYKSSIKQSRVKRTIRRVQTRSEHPGAARSAMSQLLAVEGFGDEDTIDPKDLPAKLTEAVRGFHDHARFFMHGRTGDTPPRLRVLIDAADELEEELENLKENGDLGESGGGETRHFLFMVSYERAFDVLLDAAENLSGVFKAHAEELETMRKLNEELRHAVKDAKKPLPEPDEPAFPFGTRRPLGGDGDAEIEERLMAEIDGPNPDAITPSTSEPGSPSPWQSSTPRRLSSVADTLRATSSFIRKLQSARTTRISLSHHNSTESIPRLVVDPVGPSPLAEATPASESSDDSDATPLSDAAVTMNRQGSLTFAEPIMRVRSGSALQTLGESEIRPRRGSTSSVAVTFSDEDVEE